MGDNLTQERLKELLHYNPDTGSFTCLTDRGHNSLIGDSPGSTLNTGYIQMSIDDKRYYAHRLAFLYMVGSFPTEMVDHINMVRDDNRWSNLRHATRSENRINHNLHINNKSGYKGVSWDGKNNKWYAAITYRKVHHFIGRFKCKREAAMKYNKAAVKYHGEFAVLNEVT